MLIRTSFILAILTFCGVIAVPQEAKQAPELQPGTVTFSKETLPLNEALAELHKQTGNRIIDRRSSKDNPKLTFKETTGKFWSTLDAIGTQGINFSAYHEAGVIVLVDTPYRKLTTHYSGPFRFAVKRVSVSRDDETQAHTCHVAIDTAWEPRFQMLYLNLNDAEVSFGKQSEKLERQAARPVSTVNATEIELSMKAPPRTVANISTLKGSVKVIGVPKMLEFEFNHQKLAQQQEEVKVNVTFVNTKSPTRWTVDILTVYPPGAIVPLESFQQTWMENNRVWLSWGTDPKTNKPYELEPTGQSPQDAKEGTRIRYHFMARPNVPMPPLSAKVALHYRTPNRVTAFTVPFAFENLPLP
jgi:hypothetical protein